MLAYVRVCVCPRVTAWCLRARVFKTNAVKRYGEDPNKMKVNNPGKVKTGTMEKFLTVGEVCVATFWPTPGFKCRTFVSSGF